MCFICYSPCPQDAIANRAAGQRAADGTLDRAAGERAAGERAAASNHHEARNASEESSGTSSFRTPSTTAG